MIALKFSRQQTETVLYSFIPIMELFADTRIKNLPAYDIATDQTMHAVLIRTIISDIESIFAKKLHDVAGKNIPVRLSHAQALVLFKELLSLPIDKPYYQKVRNEWIEVIGDELTAAGIFKGPLQSVA